jgi:DNA-binding MarR family transcriptional regulator
MTVPLIGERYRGVEGNIGYLLRQASQAFRTAMDETLRAHGLTAPQYTVLSVLARDPGASGADLARACNTTPQAMNGVVATLARDGLVERHPHPTHGRILQVSLSREGQRRLDAATPAVRHLERAIERGFARDDVETVKAWLVAAAQRMEAQPPPGRRPLRPSGSIAPTDQADEARRSVGTRRAGGRIRPGTRG